MPTPPAPAAQPQPATHSATPPGKLNPPAAPAQAVPREALLQRLLHTASARLVLVCGPAGFGKTTAMAQAREQLQAQGTDTAWLTLDSADNDVPRCLASLHQAVRQIVVDAPASAAPLDLVAALAQHGAPFVLFLDELEQVSEPAVLGLLRELIGQLPPRGQLVLGSRSLPELGLGRLRASGALLEIGVDQLRFSLAETTRFFHRARPAGPSIQPGAEQVATLHHKTEGWVAALWLAAMALDGVAQRAGPADGPAALAGFIDQFSGSERAVADYLAEDVLARLSPELRDFLLRTSLLRQFTAPLAQALCPRLDAAALLDRLEAAQLFITPITSTRQRSSAGQTDAQREWRYHSLFADHLRAQLQRERPDEPARLHLAASGWYEAQGRVVPAIDHAIEGGDMPHALHLLAQHAERFLDQGRMRLLARWFDALPAALLHGQPMLQVVALWATTLTRGPWQAMAQLQASGCAHSSEPAVRAHVDAMQPMLLAMMDRLDEAHALGAATLARGPSGQGFADSVLGNAMAHVLSALGRRSQAQQVLDQARRGQAEAGFNRMYSETLEGLLDLQQGRLRQATARFRLALGGHRAGSALPTHGNAWAGVLYAGAVYEAQQLAPAEHLLNVYLPLARDVGLPDHMILSHVMRARIALQRGDIDAALQTLTELEYLGHHRQLPRVVASARLERARVLLLQGQAQAAEQALARADDPALWARVAQCQMAAHDVDDLAIGRWRWQLWHGDAAQAAAELAQAAAQAVAAQRQRRALKLHWLQALALQRAGALPAALALVRKQVLPLAQAEGFARLLLDEGPPAARLLQRCAQAWQPDEGPPLDPLHDDWLQQLRQWAGEPLPEAATAPAPGSGTGADADSTEPAAAPQALEEPLTRKEIRVLQLLAEGYSNSAMAEKLFVSDSTVRTHLRNINLKLGARSRTQAVALARKAGVLG